MKSFRASLIGSAAVALVPVLGLTALAPPAFADSRSAVAAVQRAERSRGIPVSATGEVSEVPVGHATTISGQAGSLRIVSGSASNRSSGAGPAYTTESIDPSTVRLAAVFSSPEASTATWDLGSGHQLLVLPDGRVSVSDERGDLAAGIDAPWAVDATGKALTTYYTVEGTRLVQHVQFTPATAFPVVADPTVHRYFGYYTVNLNKSESAAAVGTVAGCAALFARAPYPASLVGVGCGVFAAFSTVQLAGGKCLVVHIVGFPPALATWWPTFPKC